MNPSSFKKFIAWDTESESLSLKNSRPWQNSFIIFDHSKIIEEHDDYLWWEDLNISEGARIVTKFDYTKYKTRAKDPGEMLDKFLGYLNNPEYALIGHNLIQFDVYQLKKWAGEVGREIDFGFLERTIVTLALAKAKNMGWPIDRDNFLFWQYKALNERIKAKTTLSTMAKEFNIDFDPDKLHDALYDLGLNVKVFYQLRYML
jgi:DNA polymerase III epsilon subunit-like protein